LGLISIFMDHRTLENFDTQRDLSQRQACWQEFMAQFEMKIYYVKGKDNTVADVLSCLPVVEVTEDSQPCYKLWIPGSVNVTMTISTDESFLKDVKKGYLEDNFVKKIATGMNVLGMHEENGLWYVGDRLIIPRTASCREDLFHLAHNSMGHFGADKAYVNLRESYYWPNMRKDLENVYVPGWVECQHNKSQTSKP